jgi:hypothetical protein
VYTLREEPTSVVAGYDYIDAGHQLSSFCSRLVVGQTAPEPRQTMVEDKGLVPETIL